MKIIIYGLGNLGKEFIQGIKESKWDIEIVAVTDTFLQNSDSWKKQNLVCIPASHIQNYDFDYVVVTPAKYYDEIKNSLLQLGIVREKIKTIRELARIKGELYCNLCENQLFDWKYIGEDGEIFKYKDIVGASRRKGGCPVCGSSDRTRYVYHIIKRYTDLFNDLGHSVLHFAPEKMLSDKIRAVCKEKYISADIEPGEADIMADITELPFDDEQFRYIICNHVMEHVSEEKKAFLEVRRCLAIGGTLILTVPICWDEKTFEDKKIVSRVDRIKYYGQEDHVRLYGNDIVERIEQFGFKVNLYMCNKLIDEKEQKKFGFISKDAVLMCSKLKQKIEKE